MNSLRICGCDIYKTPCITQCQPLWERTSKGGEDLMSWWINTRKKFTIEILLPSDIEHLKSATDRDKANAHAHPQMRDQKSQELRWRSLDTLLKEEDGMDEERERYQRYFEFIKMKLF